MYVYIYIHLVKHTGGFPSCAYRCHSHIVAQYIETKFRPLQLKALPLGANQ